jgi:hypothetical protein
LARAQGWTTLSGTSGSPAELEGGIRSLGEGSDVDEVRQLYVRALDERDLWRARKTQGNSGKDQGRWKFDEAARKCRNAIDHVKRPCRFRLSRSDMYN